jgi:HSP20 family protein
MMRRHLRPFMRRIENWTKDFTDEDFFSPDTDIIEKKDHIIVRIDLPGINKEDIELNITSEVIEVECEKTQQKEEKEGDYYLSERYMKGYYRKIVLPRTIVPEEARARYRNGVLEITAPKYEEEGSSEIEIED